MKTAIISYDLKNVSASDNARVKEELIKLSNVVVEKEGYNQLSAFPEWIKLSLPDTTITANVDSTATPQKITEDVKAIIESVGAKAGKIYVAFIDPNLEFLWNEQS